MDGVIKRNRDFSNTSESIEDNFISFATTKDNAAAGPDVRRKARTLNRIAKGKSSQYFSDRTTLASSIVDKDVCAVGFEVKASAAMCVQDKSLNTNAEITAEKVLEVNAAAPGVIANQISVEVP